MCKFRPGDRVRKKNGKLFDSTWEVATVSHVSIVGLRNDIIQVWFSESGTWLSPEDLELVESGLLKGFAKFMKKLDTA